MQRTDEVDCVMPRIERCAAFYRWLTVLEDRRYASLWDGFADRMAETT